MEPGTVEELFRSVTWPMTVDITTTGRRTGVARRIEIWIVQVDGRVLIGGTPGRRDWLANLRSDPQLVVHLEGDVSADLAATATEVVDPDVRREVWCDPVTAWYRSQSSLDELIADAPLVELAFAHQRSA